VQTFAGAGEGEHEEVQAPVANENPDETAGVVDFYVHNFHNAVACA
jgi:hypothetical protein